MRNVYRGRYNTSWREWDGDASEGVRGLVLYANVLYRTLEFCVGHVLHAAFVLYGHVRTAMYWVSMYCSGGFPGRVALLSRHRTNRRPFPETNVAFAMVWHIILCIWIWDLRSSILNSRFWYGRSRPRLHFAGDVQSLYLFIFTGFAIQPDSLWPP